MRTRISIALLTTACAFSAQAWGDTPDPFSGNVQFMTNYVGRGLAQSLGQPSVEGEIDYNSGPGIYGGIDGNSINWVDQLWPGDSVGMEIDGWVGYRAFYGPDWTTKFGVLRLQFPGRYVQQNPPTDEPNTTELFGYVAWKGLSAQLNCAITNEFATLDSKGSCYANLTASQTGWSDWTFTEHIGRRNETGHNPNTGATNSVNSYSDWKLAVAYDLGHNMSLTLAHTWTNADQAGFTLHGYYVGGHHTWLLLEKDF
ncbi:MAG TPA: TorF family putative porin [Gammaproteobacteria bacterium]|nr:TorF family putative porin [Gammaproteobacteria bacterium]